MTRDTEDSLFIFVFLNFLFVTVVAVAVALTTGCGTTKPNRIGSPDSCDVCHH